MMRKAICSLIAAGAALALAAPAAADAPASAREIFDAGRCIVDSDRRAAVGLISSLPIDGDAASLSSLPDRVRSRCAEGLASADVLHLRGAIAQALFFRDFGGIGIQPQRSVPLVDLDLPVQASPAGDRTVELYRWADCLVRNDGPRAERLLASPVGSRAEAAAIDRMRDYMAACAPPEAQLAVQPSELRSLLAQSAYHSMYRYWTGGLDGVRGRSD